jgi:hypothetical protein
MSRAVTSVGVGNLAQRVRHQDVRVPTFAVKIAFRIVDDASGVRHAGRTRAPGGGQGIPPVSAACGLFAWAQGGGEISTAAAIFIVADELSYACPRVPGSYKRANKIVNDPDRVEVRALPLRGDVERPVGAWLAARLAAPSASEVPNTIVVNHVAR